MTIDTTHLKEVILERDGTETRLYVEPDVARYNVMIDGSVFLGGFLSADAAEQSLAFYARDVWIQKEGWTVVSAA